MPKLMWEHGGCEQHGCFLKKGHPNVEVFDDCFPRRISFSDVDMMVEVNGHFLMIDWKRHLTVPDRGQEMMYQRLSQLPQMSVALVFGNPETMEVNFISRYIDGKRENARPIDLNGLKVLITKWCKRADED